MSQESLPALEVHRFQPSPESLRVMKALRDDLPRAQEQHPSLQGLSFFGSRTRGQERTEASSPSDLDMIVFHDPSIYEARKEAIHQQWLLHDYYAQALVQLGMPVDSYAFRAPDGTVTQKEKTILLCDISKQATQHALEQFMGSINASFCLVNPLLTQPLFRITMANSSIASFSPLAMASSRIVWKFFARFNNRKRERSILKR